MLRIKIFLLRKIILFNEWLVKRIKREVEHGDKC